MTVRHLRKGIRMIRLFITVIIAVLGATSVLAQGSSPKTATLYKNPNCSCCEGYATYLRKNGFKVVVKPTHELGRISREAGIPSDFQGCHTTFVDDYVVGGHVPVKTIRKLLTERPKIKGITLRGMPLGSPGMGGRKNKPWKIYSVGQGAPELYVTE